MERKPSEMSIESYSSTNLFQSPNHSYNILSALDELRKELQYTDTILCADAQEFPCHKVVLASSSSYFKAMFSSSLKEGRETRVEFNEISSYILGYLLDFIYTGRLEINFENVQDLLSAASLFQFYQIVEACCEFLHGHLHISNCLGIEEFSQLHSCKHLESVARQFILENFNFVMDTEEFLNLSYERLYFYVSSLDIDISSEESLFQAVVKWWEHDKKSRDKLVCGLIQQIRFSSMKSIFIEEIALKWTHNLNCLACSNLVKIETLNKTSLEINYNLIPRPSTLAKKVLVILATDENTGLNIIETYDPCKDRWLKLDTSSVCTFEASGIAVIDEDIFVVGGIRNMLSVSEVWKFLSEERRWLKQEPLNEPRSHHAIAVCNKCLYVFGGTNITIPNSFLRNAPSIETVECLDTRKPNSVWKIISKIPCPRIGSQAICFDGSIIEIGGLQYGAKVKKMESYRVSGKDNLENTSFIGEQFVLPEFIEHSKICIIDSMFYIFWEDNRKIISLNPQRRIFRDLSKPMYSHIGGGMSVVDGIIYVVGGTSEGRREQTKIIEYYDPIKDSWSQMRFYDKSWINVHCVALKMR